MKAGRLHSNMDAVNAIETGALAPEAVRDVLQFNPEERRILAGLAFSALTETHNLPADLDRERVDILAQIEQEVRNDLGLAANAPVFRTAAIHASTGNVDMGSLILHRPVGTVLASVRKSLFATPPITVRRESRIGSGGCCGRCGRQELFLTAVGRLCKSTTRITAGRASTDGRLSSKHTIAISKA